MNCYTEDEALALFIDTGMIKNAYRNIRKGDKKYRLNIYLLYDWIRLAKKRCYLENIYTN